MAERSASPRVKKEIELDTQLIQKVGELIGVVQGMSDKIDHIDTKLDVVRVDTISQINQRLAALEMTLQQMRMNVDIVQRECAALRQEFTALNARVDLNTKRINQ